MKPKIIAHGGARRNADREEERIKDVREACEAGCHILTKSSALDAVEEAIMHMEKSHVLNDGCYIPFDHILKEEGLRPVKTPKQSPWCNGYAERFVREARETLDNLILIGERELFAAMKKVERHHNYQRPHQGLDNRVPLNFEYPEKPADINAVKYHSELGGLLNHYYADKAA